MKLFVNYKKLLVFLGDLFVFAMSFCLAFLLRFDGQIPFRYQMLCLTYLPFIVLLRFACFCYFRLYRELWRYASALVMLNILKAAAVSSFLLVLVLALRGDLAGYPRSVVIIDMLLAVFFTGSGRLAFRTCRELFALRGKGVCKRVLIVGAGDAGYGILHEILKNPRLHYAVAGFLDDNPFKQRMNIQGVPVLGGTGDIARLAGQLRIDEIIIALPSADREAVRRIMEECRKSGAGIRILPGIGELIGGQVTFNQVREVRIEDLLGRATVAIDVANVRKYIAGKRVLVTGAGGSIGAEICRQTVRFSPASLVLLGRGEYSIYQIYNELSAGNCPVSLHQVIGDIINRKKVEGIFSRFRPQIVFHAGADKHVPLLELNPDEAVLNNVIGTKNVIETAERFGAERVVCISTDKAADPVSVMGCTKKIAEMIIRKRRSSSTVAMGVRFGNVLGSRGSVIPLFKKQISQGGPVTITHPDMVRYFMTIPEAARLVLEAGAIGSGGDIFLLDMGSPVRIHDLACQMIRLSGFEPGRDIPIVCVGMRPGEKLVESLTGADEKLLRTRSRKIFKLQSPPAACSDEDIEELKRLAIEMDYEGLRRKLKEIVPGYTAAPLPGARRVVPQDVPAAGEWAGLLALKRQRKAGRQNEVPV